MTPLAYAVAYQYLPAIKGLLQAGAKANRVLNEQGLTILMLAVTTGRMDVVEVLLEHKADPTLKTIDGVTAMSIAKEAGMTDIAARLERRHGV
jgi:ankyrin repeat protein